MESGLEGAESGVELGVEGAGSEVEGAGSLERLGREIDFFKKKIQRKWQF